MLLNYLVPQMNLHKFSINIARVEIKRVVPIG